MPFDYKVTLQDERGQVVETDYRVNWDPKKVDSHEVAKLCAAQRTVESGHKDRETYNRMFAGISAQLVEA